MNKKSIYELRKRDRERLLKIKEHLKPVNKILDQLKVVDENNNNIKNKIK